MNTRNFNQTPAHQQWLMNTLADKMQLWRERTMIKTAISFNKSFTDIQFYFS